jgi:hypothetical protein
MTEPTGRAAAGGTGEGQSGAAPSALGEDERRHIRLVEQYRHSVRKELEGAEGRRSIFSLMTLSDKLWSCTSSERWARSTRRSSRRVFRPGRRA